MSYQNLFKAWHEGILKKAVEEFLEMIETAHWMYERAATALWQETDFEEHKKAIRERDIRVNRLERSIRKKIIQHLAINPTSGTNQSLVLMSIVKDAERLGDYAKNLVEIGEYHPTYRDDNDLIPRFKAIQSEIEDMFRRVATAFRESNETEGQRIVTDMAGVTVTCDRLIEDILEFDGLSVRQAVSYALLARYFKRFAAHLGNIGTSLVMPTHKLDYFDEDSLR